MREGKAEALGELFRRKPGNTQVRLRLESPRDFSVLLDIDAKGAAATRSSRRRLRRSAGRIRWREWRGKEAGAEARRGVRKWSALR